MNTPATDPEVPVTFDDRVKKSFDFLQDVTKQIITISAAILTFTLSFLKDLATTADRDAREWLTRSWVLFVVSSFFGLFVLLSMTGVLGSPSDKKPTIYKTPTRILSFLQLAAFFLALMCAAIFGITWAPKP